MCYVNKSFEKTETGTHISCKIISSENYKFRQISSRVIKHVEKKERLCLMVETDKLNTRAVIHSKRNKMRERQINIYREIERE